MMPQAPKELRERWCCELCALRHLRQNFTWPQGIISPNNGYTPTTDDLSAIDYLVLEWDYGYEPALAPTAQPEKEER